MPNTKTRLKKIESKLMLKANEELSLREIFKIKRLIYAWDASNLKDEYKITIKEWERYKKYEIAIAKSRSKDHMWFKPLEKVESELVRDENCIKRLGGFKD